MEHQTSASLAATFEQEPASFASSAARDSAASVEQAAASTVDDETPASVAANGEHDAAFEVEDNSEVEDASPV